MYLRACLSVCDASCDVWFVCCWGVDELLVVPRLRMSRTLKPDEDVVADDEGGVC